MFIIKPCIPKHSFLGYFKKCVFIQQYLHLSNTSEINTMSNRVLNVAEKNDAAKNISRLLSGGNTILRPGCAKFNKVYEYQYSFRGQPATMLMTSVSGHLLTHEFSGNLRTWHSCSPEELFDAPVEKICPPDHLDTKKNIENLVRQCNALIIWTDCDREGENIGHEIINVCRAKKPNISIHRAKFSDLSAASVKRAMSQLGHMDERVINAVEVRSELDLRIGAAFTRFQTVRLQRAFPGSLNGGVVSYGSCQFPTLGFVIKRYKEIQDFIPESFWKIKVLHKINNLCVEFSWKRNRLFDQQFCQVLFDRCSEQPIEAKVEKVEVKPKSKWRPLPLDTVELEKIAGRKLRLTAKETMRIAEKLYNQGFISYPRSETNIFPKTMNFTQLLENQTVDPRWGEFAGKVLQDGANPRRGNKNDEAHPPIHPIKCPEMNTLYGNDAKVYEYITRHFLACLSKDAEGFETTVHIDIKEEKFVANGLQIVALNYLEVYIYDKWNSKEIHLYTVNQTFIPTSCDMVDGMTTAPSLLTEPELITLMDKNGIGTDATHAEHIETIKKRDYVGLVDNRYFIPKTLGFGLIDGYDNIGFADIIGHQISEPNLRAGLERDLKDICEGRKNHREVLQAQIDIYRRIFRKATQQVRKIDEAVGKYMGMQPVDVGTDNIASASQANNVDGRIAGPNSRNDGGRYVMKCVCGSDMTLKISRNGGTKFMGCTKFPDCRKSIFFPDKILDVKSAEDSCASCGKALLTFKFRPSSMSPYPNIYTGCLSGCDQSFIDRLELRHSNGRVQNNDQNGGSISNHALPNSTSNQRNFVNRAHNDWPSFNNTFNDNRAPNHRNTFDNNDGRYQPRAGSINRFQPNNNDQGGGDGIMCTCNIPVVRRFVLKDTPNKGKPFFCCSKRMNDTTRCSFFAWDTDGPLNNTQNNNNQNQRQYNTNNFDNTNRYNHNNRGHYSRDRNSGSRSSSRKCGICKQVGHNRKNCPQREEEEEDHQEI